MVTGGSLQETSNPGFVLFDTRQQSVPVILRELMPPDRVDPVSLSITVGDLNTEAPGPQLTSCSTEMY
ncbi:unnamed protein product [Schistosoma margrebowiei]|uniref:Uncharacterized protein n=1 Tax=Schistosoma margrebowiei TaxID=48269 RepID=A0A183M6H8_9TREM|nr:unnamed protein product [Schistosoma margrebowiei]